MESCLCWKFEVLAVCETEHRYFDASNHTLAEMSKSSRSAAGETSLLRNVPITFLEIKQLFCKIQF